MFVPASSIGVAPFTPWGLGCLGQMIDGVSMANGHSKGWEKRDVCACGVHRDAGRSLVSVSRI